MTKKVSFEQECPSIHYEFELINEKGSYFPDTLVIKFNGKYRDGSSGDNDAKLMKGVILTALDIWQPRTFLLDLTDFEYNWGDYIDYIFDEERNQKLAVLVGDKNRKALSTLSSGRNSNKDIVDNEGYFDDRDKALKKLLGS
jgi:hypothetical protein